MKNLYLTLSFATLTLLPAVDGLAQQASPFTSARSIATSPSRTAQSTPSTEARQKRAADIIHRSNLAAPRPLGMTSLDQFTRSRIVYGLTPAPNGHAVQQSTDEFRGGGYCIASATGSVDFGLDERIANVSFSNINNASADEAPVDPAYTFYAAPVGNVTIGLSYTLSVDVNTTTLTTGFSENQVLAWIDFNQDLDFDDAGEQVLVSTIGALDIYSGSVTIPAGALTGDTRMRIRLHDTHDGADYINVFNDTPCGAASYGEIEDYVVNISSGGGGTPPNDDCTGAVAQNLSTGATLSFSGDNTGATEDGGTGFVMVWEAFTTTECADVTINYCVAGSEFTNFLVNLAVNCPDFITGVLTGTNDPCTVTFTDLAAGTYYIPVLVDPADTPIGPYTIEVTAAACGPVDPYCEAGASSVQFEKISNVTMADINNGSAGTAGYEDFTAITGEVVVGTDYNLSVEISGGYDTDEVRAWIDFDQNQVFEDPAELVFTSALGVGPHVGTVSIPVSATLGITRMRVRLHDTYTGVDYFNFPNPTPCDTSTFGQVEDYTLNISAGGPTPPNDDCTGAIPQDLAAGATISFSGDNTGATEDGGTGFVMVWEAFTTTECTDVTINYCVVGSEFTNFLVNLAVNCPDFITGVLTGANDPCTVTFTDLAAGTYYIPVLVDPADTPVGPYTIEVSAIACPPVGPYCEAGASSVQFEKISNVTFSNINNSSAGNAGYEDFTGVTGEVVGGVDYNISVEISGGYDTDEVRAWIDFDQNQVFDDPAELVFTSPTGVGPHVGTVSIPLTAAQGATRMRVRLHDTYTGVDYFNFPNPTPCDTSTFGQVEDYTIDVVGVITGVNEGSTSSFDLFPNPTDGNVDIVTNMPDAITVIDVLEMTGRVVYSEKRQIARGQRVLLPLAGTLAAGTYAVRLSSEHGRTEQRFVVR